MPTVLIEVRKKYSPEHETALMEAVHYALQGAFKILNNDIVVRLVVHEPHRFLIPRTKSNPQLYPQPELYTHISIDCFPGRSLATKRKLYHDIVEILEALGIPRDHVKILLRETKQENWGIRGGRAGCDVNLGYTVEV